jgi:hypothetical protein
MSSVRRNSFCESIRTLVKREQVSREANEKSKFDLCADSYLFSSVGFEEPEKEYLVKK